MRVLVRRCWLSLTVCLVSVLANASSGQASPAGLEGDTPRSEQRLEQCGADAVYMCLRYYQRPADLSDIVRRFVTDEVANQGMTIAQLQDVLRAYALDNLLQGGEASLLDDWLDRGCVAVVPNDARKHFLVYLSRRGDQYLRYNPPYLSAWVSRQEIEDSWSGQAIIVSANKEIGLAPHLIGAVVSVPLRTYVFGVAAIGFSILAVLSLRSRGAGGGRPQNQA